MKKIYVGLLFSAIMGIVLLFGGAVSEAKVNRKELSFCGKPFYVDWDTGRFSNDATTYEPDIDLVITGLILSNAAEESQGNIENCLKTLGFTKKNQKHLHYDVLDFTVASPGMSFGVQPYKENGKQRYLVVAVFRGTNPNDPGDIKTDIMSQVDGFATAGINATSELGKFIKNCSYKNKIKKDNTTVLITGHSYGAAVAGHATHSINDQIARKERVFTCTYGTPNYYKPILGYEEIKNIHNYCNKEDIFTSVPIGYDKLGTTHTFKYSELTNDERSEFERIYTYIRGKVSGEENDIIQGHMTWTYMSFLLSKFTDHSDPDSVNKFTEELLAKDKVTPGKVTIKSISSKKNGQATLSWSSVKNADGYKVEVSEKKSSGFTEIPRTDEKKMTFTNKSLKKGKTYYFRVRAYKNYKSARGDAKVYGKYSAVGSVKVKGTANKAKLISLKEEKVYTSYDITGDGKKDKIKFKFISHYMDYDNATAKCKITINGSDKVIAEGYKGVEIFIFSYGKKAALLYEPIAGTAARSAVIISYDKGKYKQKNIFWEGGWTTSFSKGKDYLGIVGMAKPNNWEWYHKSFAENFKEIPFYVEAKYVFKGNTLIQKTGFKDVKSYSDGGPLICSAGCDMMVGKTLVTAEDGDGFLLEEGGVFTIKEVHKLKELYGNGLVYKIEFGTEIGWIVDSEENEFCPA